MGSVRPAVTQAHTLMGTQQTLSVSQISVLDHVDSFDKSKKPISAVARPVQSTQQSIHIEEPDLYESTQSVKTEKKIEHTAKRVFEPQGHVTVSEVKSDELPLDIVEIKDIKGKATPTMK